MATPNCGAQARVVPARVILLGEPGAGKSSLFYRIKHRRFKEGSTSSDLVQRGVSETQPLFGVPSQPSHYDSCSRRINISQDLQVNLTIFDIRTEERGQSPSAHYYRRVQAVLLVCSMDSEFSLTRLSFWLEEAQLYCNEQRIVFAVVGTKSDIPEQQREVTSETISAFAHHHRLPFFLVSAKTGSGVDNLLKKVAQHVIDLRLPTGTGHSTRDAWSAEADEGHPLWRSHRESYRANLPTEETPILTTRDLNKTTPCCPHCSIL